MLKKILKILLSIWLFISLITNVFAFDANLNVDKNTLNINDTLNLRLELNSSKWWKFEVLEIKWLENFKKLWQSQSQSSSTQIVSINWKMKQETKTTINLDLVLKPLKTWEFEIGPAIISDWQTKFKTNSIKVKIDWNKIQWIKQNSPIIPFIKGDEQQKEKEENKNSKNNLEQKEKLQKEHVSDNNYELYLLILVLALTSGIFYFLIKNKKTPSSKGGGQSQKTPLLSKEGMGVVSEIDFEKKEEKIDFPEITDNDFINKIDKIFRKKIAKKFNIKNIETLWNSEILEILTPPLTPPYKGGGQSQKTPLISKNELELVSEIIELLNKAKYSKNITDNNKLLELIKNI